MASKNEAQTAISEGEKTLNLSLWREVEKTDPRFTAEVKTGGRKFTAIDAYWQIRKATELWGPYGSGWGLFETSLSFELIASHQIIIYKAVFRYPEGEFPIINTAKIVFDEREKDGVVRKERAIDDWAKKIETDTLTKALSRLGFSADVFLGLFEDNRYIQDRLREEQEKEKGQKRAPGKAPEKAPAKQEPTPLDKVSGLFSLIMEQLAKAVSELAKKNVTRDWLIENRLSKEQNWPKGPQTEWSIEDFEAAVKIIESKMSATTKKEDK